MICCVVAVQQSGCRVVEATAITYFIVHLCKQQDSEVTPLTAFCLSVDLLGLCVL